MNGVDALNDRGSIILFDYNLVELISAGRALSGRRRGVRQELDGA